jgi:hypothetical protein
LGSTIPIELEIQERGITISQNMQFLDKGVNVNQNEVSSSILKEVPKNDITKMYIHFFNFIKCLLDLSTTDFGMKDLLLSQAN